MAGPKPPQRTQQPSPQAQKQGTNGGASLKMHSGPLPDPQTLRDYDDLIPGSAAEIIKMASDQASHRREMERASLESDSAARTRQIEVENARIQGAIMTDRLGMFFGWAIAASSVAAGVYAMVADKYPAVTIAFLGLPIAGIITAIRKKR